MTPSPVLPSDVQETISSPTATLCGNFVNTLLRLPTLVYEWINWMLDSSGNVTNDFKKQIIPAGLMMPSASDVTPAGWLVCNGASYSRPISAGGTEDTYTDLWTAIGITYGSTSAGTFKVPDMQAKFIVGVGTFESGAGVALGAAVGAEKVALSIAEAGLDHIHINGRFHSNSGAPGSDFEVVTTDQDMGQGGTPTQGCNGENNYQVSTLGAWTGRYGVTTPAFKSDATAMTPTAHNNIPPAIGLKWLIKH